MHSKEFFAANIKLIIGVIVILAIGGAVWFVSSNGTPTLSSYTAVRGNIVESLNEPGTVVAEDKSDLSFQEPGQIAHVYVHEGEVVGSGDALADLDSASLEANIEQANAGLASAQAKLDSLEVGATPQTVAVSQAALTSAKQTLANTYTSVPNTLNDAYAKADDAVRNQLANFFTNAEESNPQLTFSVSDPNVLNNIQSMRVSASADLNTWRMQLADISTSSSSSALGTALQNASDYLLPIQSLMNESLTALTDEAGLPASTVATYKTSATVGLNEVNAAIVEVTGSQQSIASEEAGVSQAQAGLNLTKASSTPQIIEEQQAAVAQAQAAVTAAQVALDNASLTAPFPGTVQDLTAQVGQVVSPGVPVLTLINNNGLKIEAYVSEADVANIKAGDMAQVTLDAFGTGTTFPATVTTVDSAETQVNGVPSYLVTLHFTNSEPQVRDGMTGNVNIILAKDDNVIVVPSRLVINDGNQHFVLVRTATGTERKQVQIGLVGDNGMTEITSGVNENDTLVDF